MRKGMRSRKKVEQDEKLRKLLSIAIENRIVLIE